MKVQALTLTGILLGLVTAPVIADESARLLRQPDLSASHITFVYGGDIWLADRDGSNPRPLTTSPAPESNPKFSPDGKWIAFTGNYDSNADVYVMPITGGQPTRLTYHPSGDVVNGWSPNGDKVLFASNREILNSRSNQLFEIAVDGGYPTKAMTAVAYEGQWSDDGERLAYRPNNMAYSGASGWRLHRGGSTPPIWIMDVADNKLERVPHPNANEHNPFWLGDSVYFLSDRDNVAMNLFRYEDGDVEQLTQHSDWDIQSASGHGNHVIYEAGGYLYLMNVDSGARDVLTVQLNAQSEQRRPQWKDASRQLTSAQLSTTGQRILVTARGDIFTVPAKDGSTRNLTATSGVREFDALWSADGTQVAYISDQGNRHSLVIAAQDGSGEPKKFLLGETGYFNLLAWSPTGDRIVYQDNHLNLYSFDVASESMQRIATTPRRADFQVSFTSDGRYLAFTTSEANYFSQITIHDFTTGDQHRLTDGMSHAQNPVFTDDYLYFAASVNTGPSQVGLDLSTQERPVRLGIYAAVLSNDGQSPLFPKTGDEPAASAEDKSATEEDADKSVTIDFDSIQNRIVGLPIAEKNYGKLGVGKDGGLFILESPQAGASNEPPGSGGPGDATLHRFNFEEQKLETVESGISTFELSPDRSKLLLITRPNQLKLGDAAAKPDAKPVKLSDVQSFIDPAAEWQQIFDDTWRMQKEYFYDPNMHGIDWDAMHDKYQPMLAHVQRREDLNDVLVQLIAELQVGHNRVGGGDVYRGESTNTGLLGADFAITDGHYQVTRVYQGDRWSPYLDAPLAQPGATVAAGEFILAINGQAIGSQTNIFQHLEQTAGQQVTLTVASDASGSNSREVLVKPTQSESTLRLWHWVEQNRQYVDEESNGQVGYIYLPNTADGGFYFFNRMFFAQVDKPALIIDERKNGGGQAANYITEILARPFLSGWKDRDGLTFSTPGGGIYGPKTMLIDQDAGSGGDFLPWSFKRLGLGKLIGTRTWGGLIGISTNPSLIDGGGHVVPFFRFYTPDGEWRVENEGVAPDIEVVLDPTLVNQGRDPQLERAVAETLKELQANPPADHSEAPAMPTKLGL